MSSNVIRGISSEEPASVITDRNRKEAATVAKRKYEPPHCHSIKLLATEAKFTTVHETAVTGS